MKHRLQPKDTRILSLIGMEGEVRKYSASYIIHDHDRQKFEARKHFIAEMCRKG